MLIVLTGCSEKNAEITESVVLPVDSEQKAIDIILKINEKYNNMRDFKAVKTIKKGNGVKEEKIMIKGDKYKIERNNEIEVSDGKKVGIYKKIAPREEYSGESDYMFLGYLYNELGRVDEAEEMFKEALDANPDVKRNYLELGILYNEWGRVDEAEEMFKETEEMFKEALDANLDEKWSYWDLGILYNEWGKVDEAEEMFKEALDANPDEKGIYLDLGSLYKEQGRVEEAEEMFKEVMIDEGVAEELEPTYEIKQEVRYGELQRIADILNFNDFRFSLEQDKDYYILEGKKSKSTALFSKIKAEINKEDYSIARLEFYNELGRVERLAKTIIYENISFNNGFSDEDFMIAEA